MSIIPCINTNEVAVFDCVQRFFSSHKIGNLLKKCNGTKEKACICSREPVLLKKDSQKIPFIGSLIRQRQTGFVLHLYWQLKSSTMRLKTLQMKAPDAMLQLLDEAVWAGLCADYVLFDCWFANPAQITAIKSKGMDVIAMIKKSSRIQYLYEGKKIRCKWPISHIHAPYAS